MNILMSANDTMIEGLELVIYSLLTFNKEVNIYIFTMDIEVDHKEEGFIQRFEALSMNNRNWLTKIVRYLDPNSNIIFVDVHDAYMKHLYGGVNECTPFTPFTALRLLPDIVIPEVPHCLYLDCDIAIAGDIKDMYYSYLNLDVPYSASNAYDAFEGKGEMVAGVMLMNLDKMKSMDFMAKAREKYKKNLYRFPDQMAIRDTGDGAKLPEIYGYMEPLESCYIDPKIIHFTNNLGPKIYDRSRAHNKEFFYRRFPQFNYVNKGLELIKDLNMKI